LTGLRYCQICVLPHTRPNIDFDSEGRNCSCATSQKSEAVDWRAREKAFCDLVGEIKDKGAVYDCVIPVSGGKDSTWQTLMALEYGLRPLCVTWKSPVRTVLGGKNLTNLISLGVDHVDFSINPDVERKFTLQAFERFGSPVIPMHMAIHAIPLQIATSFRIPLVLWGENSAVEYGGTGESLRGFEISDEWLMKYGVTNGTRAEDWISGALTADELTPYFWPSEKIQREAGVKGVFLGHFFKWDPLETFRVARDRGFEADETPRTGIYDFADIDDAFLITVHHWMKWLKFGFTRAWDNLSIEIRNNRLTRSEALEWLSRLREGPPHAAIEEFCRYVDISENRFWDIANSFRNPDIWEKSSSGFWSLKGFILDGWDWSDEVY